MHATFRRFFEFTETLRGRGRGEKGFVLILVLFLTAVLVAVVGEFVYTTYVATSRAAGFADGQRAGHLAANSVELARKAIEEFTKSMPNMTMDENGAVFTRTEGGMDLTLRVFDESARLSANIVYTNTGVAIDHREEAFRALLEDLGLEERLADTLADWIDSDEEPRLQGAEGPDYYTGLAVPYNPRNGYLSTVEEIRMIRGYTPEAVEALRPHITVYNPDGRVNINTATIEVLKAVSPDMTEQLARNIMGRRLEAPFKDRSEVMKVSGFETIGFGLQDKITTSSTVYRVLSEVSTESTTRRVEAVVQVGKGILYWRES